MTWYTNSNRLARHRIRVTRSQVVTPAIFSTTKFTEPARPYECISNNHRSPTYERRVATDAKDYLQVYIEIMKILMILFVTLLCVGVAEYNQMKITWQDKTPSSSNYAIQLHSNDVVYTDWQTLGNDLHSFVCQTSLSLQVFADTYSQRVFVSSRHWYNALQNDTSLKTLCLSCLYEKLVNGSAYEFMPSMSNDDRHVQTTTGYFSTLTHPSTIPIKNPFLRVSYVELNDVVLNVTNQTSKIIMSQMDKPDHFDRVETLARSWMGFLNATWAQDSLDDGDHDFEPYNTTLKYPLKQAVVYYAARGLRVAVQVGAIIRIESEKVLITSVLVFHDFRRAADTIWIKIVGIIVYISKSV